MKNLASILAAANSNVQKHSAFAMPVVEDPPPPPDPDGAEENRRWREEIERAGDEGGGDAASMPAALASALEFEPLALDAIDDEHRMDEGDEAVTHGLFGDRASPPPTLEEILLDTDYLDPTREGEEDADDGDVRLGSSVYSSSVGSSSDAQVPTSLLETLSLQSRGSGDSKSRTSAKSSRSRKAAAAAARAKASKSKGSIMRYFCFLHGFIKGRNDHNTV